jgi:hypothetical protein
MAESGKAGRMLLPRTPEAARKAANLSGPDSSDPAGPVVRNPQAAPGQAAPFGAPPCGEARRSLRGS